MVTMEETMIHMLPHLLPTLISIQPPETKKLTMGAIKGKTNNRKPKDGYDSL